jgi:hypothetical protein
VLQWRCTGGVRLTEEQCPFEPCWCIMMYGIHNYTYIYTESLHISILYIYTHCILYTVYIYIYIFIAINNNNNGGNNKKKLLLFLVYCYCKYVYYYHYMMYKYMVMAKCRPIWDLWMCIPNLVSGVYEATNELSDSIHIPYQKWGAKELWIEFSKHI